MSQQPNRPSAEQMAKFKKNANDSSLSAEVRAKFKAIVDKFENVTEEVGEDVVKEVEPAKKRGRKPRATSTTKTTKTTKTKQSATDVEKAKAEIKKRTGKTEEECESIIDEYRALRTKAQEGKRKAEQASAENKNRVDKLENKGDLIEGTNVKTADAVIESTAKDVAEKIEQQIEAVEEKAEKEAKAEVAKDNTIKTPKDKKEAVKEKVEEKVKKETKVVVERVVIDTSALLTSIATSLGKFDKDSQKEFLIKLRSDIDKLLAKYAFGGMTDGAVQMMNIQQSNLSASSVNPTMFANGGGVFSKGRVVLADGKGVGGNKNKTYQLIKFDYTDGSGDEGFEIREMPSNKVMSQGKNYGEVLQYFNLYTGKFANGGGVSSRTKVKVGDEKIAVIKNRKEVKGYPVYVTTQGYLPQTIGVFETKEQAEKKAMQIRKKNKYANGGEIEEKGLYPIKNFTKVVNHFNSGDQWDLEEYPPYSGKGTIKEWMGEYPTDLEDAKAFIFESHPDWASEYEEEINDAKDNEELQDILYENDCPLFKMDNTYNSDWWGGVVQTGVLQADEDGYSGALVFVQFHRGGDVRGNYGEVQAFILNSFYEDFPLFASNLTYTIETNRGDVILDTQDFEGYTLLVVEDATGNFEEGEDVTLDELSKTFDLRGYSLYAKGGLTEHGLMPGDKIRNDFSLIYPDDKKYKNIIDVVDRNNNIHLVDLNKGERYGKMAKGGKLWIDTKKKGGLKGVKPSRKNTFRNEAVKRGISSGTLASRVIANPSRYKGINPKSAQLVKNMGVRKHGGSIGDILRNRRGE